MRAVRYVSWLHRHSLGVLIASALLVAGSVYLATFHLPLQSDFSALLPADAPAVKAAEVLSARTPARDRMLFIISATDPATRTAAAQLASDGLRVIDRELVEHVESEDGSLRDFVRAHQGLYVPLADLQRIKAALADEISAAKLRANPLYIPLDDEPAKSGAGDLEELRTKQREALARLDKQPFVSRDGRMQVFVLHTAFRATDVDRDHVLMAKLEALRGQITSIQPAATIGFAGGPAVSVAEHRALSHGIVLSSVLTMVLVSLLLWLHLRSVRLVVLLAVNIVAGTAISFGAAALSVGHLNAATAFLGAIIAGNGVNYGILLVARWREERRASDAQQALAIAIKGTLVPTLVASLGASIAYGSLAATKFRGFADFAWIGGIGMLVCWIATFVLLPVLVLRYIRAPLAAQPDHFGRVVVRVFGFSRPAVVCAVAGVVTLGAGALSWHYLTNDPYEYDLTQLRSQAPDANEARRWMKVSDENFGRGLAGLAGQTFVAVDAPAQLPGVVAELEAIAQKDSIVGPISSVLDAVPQDQPAKLALLADIRAQIDDAIDALDDDDRAELLALRPADDLRELTAADLPPSLLRALTERDGRIGLMVSVKPGATFDERNGRDLIRFAGALRPLSKDGVIAAGASTMFADVLLQIQADGPLITGIAAVGLVIMVLLVVGRTRRAVAVLAASSAGSILMVAVCAIAGLEINFLDFVALPITLGLGIDYAINIADRATHSDPLVALRSTGGSVLVCSLTTIIGYMSLLVSDNLSIRGFGIASLIGEVTCMIAAFIIVPAVIALPQLSRASAFGVDTASSRA